MVVSQHLGKDGQTVTQCFRIERSVLRAMDITELKAMYADTQASICRAEAVLKHHPALKDRVNVKKVYRAMVVERRRIADEMTRKYSIELGFVSAGGEIKK